MKKAFSMRDVAMACLAMSAAMGAHAVLQVQQFTSANGVESGPGTITYDHAPTSVSGNALQVLTLDATQGGNYVGSSFKLATQGGVSGTHVRFRVRAPLVNQLGLRAYIGTNTQAWQFAIDRSNTVIDDQGWATVTVPISSVPVNIVGLQLLLSRNELLGKTSTAYFKGIEVLPAAPTANDPVLPLRIVNIETPALIRGVEHGPVTGTLETITPPLSSGNEVQYVNFSFPAGSGGYGAAIANITPVDASYAHFRLRAPAQTRIRLQVIDNDGQTLQYDIDRTAEVIDSAGWASHGVRLDKPVHFYGGSNSGKVKGPIKSVRLLARGAGSSGPATAGTAYFKEVDLLSSVPSPTAPLHPLVTPTQAGPVVIVNVPYLLPSVPPPSASVDANAGIEGLTQVLKYNLGKTYPALTPRDSFAGVSFQPVTTAQGNRLRFLAKVPQGVSIRLRLKDETGQVAYEANVVKPLGTVDDAGWVPYVVKLDRDDKGRVLTGGITEVQLGIRRNTNVSVNNSFVEPIGEARFGQLWIGHEPDQLDLGPTTPTFAGAKPRGADPLPPVFGVAARDVANTASLAKSLGFNHVRMDLSWSTVERVNGTYNFAPYDAAVSKIHQEGMTPILILAYNNNLHSGKTSDHQGVSTIENRNAYVRFVTAAAKHFKPLLSSTKSIVFEVWNEPDLPSFWLDEPNPANYAELLNVAAPAIKQEDTRFKVLSGGLANLNFTFLSATTSTLASLSTQKHIDGVGVHPYTKDLEYDVEPETQADEILAARRRLKEGGVNVPLWATESGFSSANRSPKFGVVDGLLQSNRVKQAQRVVREVLTGMAVDSPSHVVYQLKDAYNTPYSQYESENNYGVVDRFGADKPLKTALNALQKAVSGLKYQGLVTGSPSNVQAMKFGAAGKDTVYIVWANGPGSQVDVSILPNCQTGFGGAAATHWSSCVMDVGQQAVDCKPAANGRYSCPVSEAAGPLFVRTRRP